MSERGNNSRDDKRKKKKKIRRFFFSVFHIDYLQFEKTRKMMMRKRDDCPEKNREKKEKQTGLLLSAQHCP